MHRSPILFISIVVMLGGCAHTAPPTPAAAPDFSYSGFELYMSKRSLSDIEFEQYTVEPQRIFRECGKLRRGRFLPQRQDLLELAADDSARLKQELHETLQSFDGSKATFEAPGTNAELWDPGQLNFSLHVGQDQPDRIVKTSLNCVAAAETIPAAALKKLVTLVRELGKSAACPNPAFFGVTSQVKRELP